MTLQLRRGHEEERPEDTRHRHVEQPERLRAITRAGVDLCTWRRPGPPGLSGWLEAVVARHALAFEERAVTVAQEPWRRAVQPLPSGPERDQLAADVELLCRLYTRLLGDVALRVQLTTVATRKCPQVHVDAVGIRLLCTYCGPGTEWIPEAHLDRQALHLRRGQDTPLRPGGQLRRLEPFEVALMKGAAWPGNGRFGTAHRSPAVEGPPRLVLTVDTTRPPGRP